MAERSRFPVLVATDGSTQGHVAVRAAAIFPWPRNARVRAMVARGVVGTPEWPSHVREEVDRNLQEVARGARRALAGRWPDMEAIVVNHFPAQGILSEARRLGARAIVVGSRGHGPLRRLMVGSVSRDVVRRATCPVLVVRGKLRHVRSLVVGLDGSTNSRRAVAFLAGLESADQGRLTLLRVLEPVHLPSMGLLPGSVRATLSREAAKMSAARLRVATREVGAAGRRLRQSGWAVRAVIRPGAPLSELLETVKSARADVLVVGARGTGGVERLLLGSVAEGVLNRSPISVLVVK